MCTYVTTEIMYDLPFIHSRAGFSLTNLNLVRSLVADRSKYIWVRDIIITLPILILRLVLSYDREKEIS